MQDFPEIGVNGAGLKSEDDASLPGGFAPGDPVETVPLPRAEGEGRGVAGGLRPQPGDAVMKLVGGELQAAQQRPAARRLSPSRVGDARDIAPGTMQRDGQAMGEPGLRRPGHEHALRGAQGKRLAQIPPQIGLGDLRRPGDDGVDLLTILRDVGPRPVGGVIEQRGVVTGHRGAGQMGVGDMGVAAFPRRRLQG